MTGMFPWDEVEHNSHPNVTPLAAGNVTKEEEEQAFEDLFRESHNAFDKWFDEGGNQI